jgi:Uncharacterized conserved protein
VTRQEMGNETTTMYAEGADLVIERNFDAPRERVWEALTSPDHIPRWWGPPGTTSTVAQMEVHPGGRWRWINRTADGQEAPFTGEYLELAPPERVVRTMVYDIEPVNRGPGAVETITLDEFDGRTTLRHHTRFPSEAVLQRALSTGMPEGAIKTYDRLSGLLTEMT